MASFFKPKESAGVVVTKKNRSRTTMIIAIVCAGIAAITAYNAISAYLGLQQVVVIATDIEPYTILNQSHLTYASVPKQFSSNMITDTSLVEGRAVKSFVPKGTPITEAMLAKKGEGGLLSTKVTELKDPKMRAISIPVTAVEACGGDIVPGDIVDVVSTMQLNSSSQQGQSVKLVSKIIMSGVRVIKVVGEGKELSAVVVADNPGNAQDVKFAAAGGKISIILHPYNSDKSADKTTTTTIESFMAKYINNTQTETPVTPPVNQPLAQPTNK